MLDVTFCSKCGVEILAKEAYCTACGAQIDITTTSRISEQLSNTPKVIASESKKNDDSTGVIGTVVIVFLIAFGYMKYEGFNAISTSCNMINYQKATCQFTNEYFLPDTKCIKLKSSNKKSSDFVESDMVCSGVVWPRESVEKNVYIDVTAVCRTDCSLTLAD